MHASRIDQATLAKYTKSYGSTYGWDEVYLYVQDLKASTGAAKKRRRCE